MRKKSAKLEYFTPKTRASGVRFQRSTSCLIQTPTAKLQPSKTQDPKLNFTSLSTCTNQNPTIIKSIIPPAIAKLLITLWIKKLKFCPYFLVYNLSQRTRNICYRNNTIRNIKTTQLFLNMNKGNACLLCNITIVLSISNENHLFKKIRIPYCFRKELEMFNSLYK